MNLWDLFCFVFLSWDKIRLKTQNSAPLRCIFWKKLRKHTVLVRVTITLRNTITKATGKGKGLFYLRFHFAVRLQRKSRRELKQGRNLEARAGAEAMEKCGLLTCSLHDLLSLLSYRIQENHCRYGTTHTWVGPPPSITN